MFRTVFPSIIRSWVECPQPVFTIQMYIKHHAIKVLWLLASGNEKELFVPASKQPQNLYDTYLMLYVQS